MTCSGQEKIKFYITRVMLMFDKKMQKPNYQFNCLELARFGKVPN